MSREKSVRDRSYFFLRFHQLHHIATRVSLTQSSQSESEINDSPTSQILSSHSETNLSKRSLTIILSNMPDSEYQFSASI